MVNVDVFAFSDVSEVGKISVMTVEGVVSVSTGTLSVVPSNDSSPSFFAVGVWNVVVDKIAVSNFFVVVCGVVVDLAGVVVDDDDCIVV